MVRGSMIDAHFGTPEAPEAVTPTKQSEKLR